MIFGEHRLTIGAGWLLRELASADFARALARSAFGMFADQVPGSLFQKDKLSVFEENIRESACSSWCSKFRFIFSRYA
jgi:hypothetical protein